MKKNEAYPSKWINVADVHDKGVVAMKISGVETREVGMGEKMEEKPVMGFSKSSIASLATKGLVLGKTKWDACEAILGSGDSDDWVGKVIGLKEGKIMFAGKMVACVDIVAAPSKEQVQAQLAKFAPAPMAMATPEEAI